MTAIEIDSSTRARPSDRVAWVYAALAAAWIATSLLGLVGDLVLVVLAVSSLVANVYGLTRYRPSVRWPFACFSGLIVLGALASATRNALHTLGDLSPHRSLLPDAIALPSYVFFGVGLFGLGWVRRGRTLDVDTLLDGSLAGLAALACAWAYLITPALAHQHTSLEIRLVLALYPPMSVFLLASGFEILSSGGSGRRPPAQRILLASLVFFLIGDVVYMLVDARIASLPSRIIDLPYAIAIAGFATMHFHPSMRELCEPVPRDERGPTGTRLAFVAIALGFPALVVMSKLGGPAGDRWVLAVVVLALTAAAIWRVFRALRAHARSEERIVQQATHDSLTGLPNRLYVDDRLVQALARRSNTDKAVALLFLDLDRFKLVNDALGHGVGDDLLVAVAKRLVGVTPDDAVVARIGGDEFVVILEYVERQEAALRIAEEIRGAFGIPFSVRDSEIHASVSIGVTFSTPEEPGSYESLLRDADTAMYQAKDAGRDAIVVFDAEMRTRTARRLLLERDLRGALRRGELTLHFQPVIDMTSRRVCGFEALVRWNHPTLGMVPPIDFIPVAEETGMIVELGSWVLDTACLQLAEWKASLANAGSLYVAVNLSARQLREPTFLDAVTQSLARSGLDIDSVRLELTESLFMEQKSAALEVIRRLHDRGLRISIDDFGTGYSSLAYLRRFRVDEVKIDKSFVDDIARPDAAEESLVRAIVAIARALGMSTTAEGVETVAQAERLRELGVDSAQGYVYSRPVPADQVPATLARLNQLASEGGTVDDAGALVEVPESA